MGNQQSSSTLSDPTPVAKPAPAVLPVYTTVNQLTEENIGSSIIANRCNAARDEYHCKALHGLLFCMLNENKQRDNNPLQTICQSGGVLGYNWRRNGHRDVLYHSNNVLERYSIEVRTEETDKVLSKFKELDSMTKDELAQVSSIHVPQVESTNDVPVNSIIASAPPICETNVDD